MKQLCIDNIEYQKLGNFRVQHYLKQTKGVVASFKKGKIIGDQSLQTLPQHEHRYLVSFLVSKKTVPSQKKRNTFNF